MVMNAINFARAFGLSYVHSPFTAIQHADRPMKEWVAAWEALFNLGAGEGVYDIRTRDAVNFSYNFNDLDRCFGWRSRGDELAQAQIRSEQIHAQDGRSDGRRARPSR
jgi:hypothetical protein